MKHFLKRTALAMILLLWLPQTANAARLLIPAGEVIGLVLQDNTVTVAAFDETLGSTAKTAGLRVGDQIVKIDNTQITSSEDVHNALTHSRGRVSVNVLRNGKQKEIKIIPEITQQGPKLGVYLRQGITGVGTVTWYDPETKMFGSLGHSVNTSGGNVAQMKEGTAYSASVASVVKGQPGQPGQLMGSLERNTPVGKLTKNTQQGVFGKSESGFQGVLLPTAEAEDITVGPAYIRSTVQNRQVQEYSVEILKIYPSNRDNGRNMLIQVTDPALLQATGGIVQGMSGSPIIQNGRLVGAVTHVLVNDPTMGYGIFIENMLDAAA